MELDRDQERRCPLQYSGNNDFWTRVSSFLRESSLISGGSRRSGNLSSSAVALKNTTEEDLRQDLHHFIGDYFHRNAHIARTCSSETMEELYSHVPRIEQLEVWDCGIICLMMALRWIEQPSDNVDNQGDQKMTNEEGERYRFIRNAIPTESIWTADLVLYLLLNEDCFKQQGNYSICENNYRASSHASTKASFFFCSKTFQVSSEYEGVNYYKDSYSSDEQRVNATFSTLQSKIYANLPGPTNMMKCYPNGLSINTILDAVICPNCIAIALIDYSILFRPTSSSFSSSFNSTKPLNFKNNSYVGHYVILTGISRNPDHIRKATMITTMTTTTTTHEERETKQHHQQQEKDAITETFCLVLSDPGQGRPSITYVTREQFDLARTAKGTDQDILFLVKRK